MNDLTAVLLCGGKGERLKPYTETLPKPLIPIRGEPLLLHLVRLLGSLGIARFVFCLGYKAEMIERFIAEHFPGRREFVSVNSGDASMTDRIRDARPHVPGPALVCYGDTLANIDLAALRALHQKNGALATLTIHPMRSPFGIVEFEPSGKVARFREKPQLPYWVNIGFLLCEPAALDQISPGSDMPEFLDRLADAGKLYVYRHEGGHLTVNTEKERAEAESQIAEMLTP